MGIDEKSGTALGGSSQGEMVRLGMGHPFKTLLFTTGQQVKTMKRKIKTIYPLVNSYGKSLVLMGKSM